MSRSAGRSPRRGILPPPLAPRLIEDASGEESTSEGDGFLWVRRARYRLQWDDAPPGPAFGYDSIRRHALDAVAIVLWRRGAMETEVLLRSSVRPTLADRVAAKVPDPLVDSVALWEVPAGLVEPTASATESPEHCASRESLEETGLRIPPEDFAPLGPPVFPSPGVLPEAVWFLHAEVDGTAGSESPSGDGSPLEARAALRWIPLSDALRAARRGELPDAKTELALRRLAEAAPWRRET